MQTIFIVTLYFLLQKKSNYEADTVYRFNSQTLEQLLSAAFSFLSHSLTNSLSVLVSMPLPYMI